VANPILVTGAAGRVGAVGRTAGVSSRGDSHENLLSRFKRLLRWCLVRTRA
jgi:hypothetical protein